jgi:hypothetical protein
VPTQQQDENPMIRMAFRQSDLTALAQQLDGWNHPAYFRIRARLAEHGVDIFNNQHGAQEGATS